MVNLTSVKKYTHALKNTIDKREIGAFMEALLKLSELFKNVEFCDIINSPVVSKEKKEKLIMSFIESKNKKFVNFLKLLNEKNRLGEIPYIYDELNKYINSNNNQFELSISSYFELDSKDEEKVVKNISDKLNVSLYSKKSHIDSEGIRLFVNGISVEASLFKDKLSSDIKEHILKAF